MRNLLLCFWAAVLCLALAGCVHTTYRAKEFGDNGQLARQVDFTYSKAMVNDTKKDLHVVLGDGAGIDVGEVITTADPNSARAIGRAVADTLLPVLKDNP